MTFAEVYDQREDDVTDAGFTEFGEKEQRGPESETTSSLFCDGPRTKSMFRYLSDNQTT